MDTKLDGLKFDSNGLIPAIIQDAVTNQVLMFAFMNQVSVEKTVETGLCHYWSRSRQKLWLKGESSGHTQTVKSIKTDCDLDVLLIEVEQKGAACHDGYTSCFYRTYDKEQPDWKIVGEKQFDPAKVYGK
ncbi:MAG: phosphoribosyl-AMP cyclohydrolase [Tepidisphaeraceae bacterium]